jgi:hypothetical protein
MKKSTSGLTLIIAGIAMNLVGRLFKDWGTDSLFVAGFALVWMFASVVLIIFGLLWLIVGLVRKG